MPGSGEMEKMADKKKENRIVSFIRGFFRKNLVIKILSLVFAVLIWAYVLADQNPYRIKTVPDVAVSFEGEADLQARNLVVRGDRAEILSSVVAYVSTQITDYANLSAQDITATISLKNVNTPGVKQIPITATVSTRWGTVESISPTSVSLEIDRLTTKYVPVEVRYTGTLPQNYWHGPEELGQKTVQIRGAKQDVDRVTRAICTIDLDGRTESYNDAVYVTLVDKSGEEVDPDLLLGDLPSVTVKMAVLPVKTVGFNMDTLLEGQDNLPANYSVTDITIKPQTVQIVGRQEVLDNIDALNLETINVAGKRENISTYLSVIVPEDVILLDDDSVQVLITIQEDRTTKTFADVPIQIQGLGDKLQASTHSISTTDVTVFGPISIVSSIERKDISAYIDVTGKRPGTFDLEVEVFLSDEVQSRPETITSSAERVIVVISEQ